MLTGVVNADRDPLLELRVRGPRGRECLVEALIDTGFDGWLSLPPAVLASLSLTWRRRGRALLAVGRESLFDIYEARLFWDGRWRRISVDENDTLPLVGTALLSGHQLTIDFETGGSVTVQALPHIRQPK